MVGRVEMIGDATLYLGDCLEILPTLETGSVDAILTDLPYGTTACKWDEIIPFEPMWAQVKRLLKPRGVFVTTASQPFTSKLVMSNPDWFRYEWIWEKNFGTRHLDANRRPLLFHENIVVFSENGHAYNPQRWNGAPNHSCNPRGEIKSNIYQKENGRPSNDISGLKYPRSVIKIETMVAKIKEHPTQKPVALYSYLALTYTNPGDVILDFVMGSGTTGVAALRLGRKFIGIEIEPKYFDIACKRIEQENRQIKMF